MEGELGFRELLQRLERSSQGSKDPDLDGVAQLLERLLPAAVQDDSNPLLQAVARDAAEVFPPLVRCIRRQDALMPAVPFVFYRAPVVLAGALARPAPCATAVAIVRSLAAAVALMAAAGAADVMPPGELLAALVAWMPVLQRLMVQPGGAGHQDAVNLILRVVDVMLFDDCGARRQGGALAQQVTRCVPVVTSAFIACVLTIQALRAWSDPDEGGSGGSGGSTAGGEGAQPEGSAAAAAAQQAEEGPVAGGRSTGGALCEERWQVLARCLRFLALQDLHQVLASMTRPQEWRIPMGLVVSHPNLARALNLAFLHTMYEDSRGDPGCAAAAQLRTLAHNFWQYSHGLRDIHLALAAEGLTSLSTTQEALVVGVTSLAGTLTLWLDYLEREGVLGGGSGGGQHAEQDGAACGGQQPGAAAGSNPEPGGAAAVGQQQQEAGGPRGTGQGARCGGPPERAAALHGAAAACTAALAVHLEALREAHLVIHPCDWGPAEPPEPWGPGYIPGFEPQVSFRPASRRRPPPPSQQQQQQAAGSAAAEGGRGGSGGAAGRGGVGRAVNPNAVILDWDVAAIQQKSGPGTHQIVGLDTMFAPGDAVHVRFIEMGLAAARCALNLIARYAAMLDSLLEGLEGAEDLLDEDKPSQVLSCWVGEFVAALLSFHHRGSTQLLLASEAEALLPPLLSFMHAQARAARSLLLLASSWSNVRQHVHVDLLTDLVDVVEGLCSRLQSPAAAARLRTAAAYVAVASGRHLLQLNMACQDEIREYMEASEALEGAATCMLDTFVDLAGFYLIPMASVELARHLAAAGWGPTAARAGLGTLLREAIQHQLELLPVRNEGAPRALFQKLADACKVPAVALAVVESGLLSDVVCWMCKMLEEQGHEEAQDARFVATAQAHASALVQCCCAVVDSVAGTHFVEHQERIKASIRSSLVAGSQASGARPSAVAIGTNAWRERRDQLLPRMRHTVRSGRCWAYACGPAGRSGAGCMLQLALVLGRAVSSISGCVTLPPGHGAAGVPAAAVEREWAMAIAGCANPLCRGKEDDGGFSLPASLPVCGGCGVARWCGEECAEEDWKRHGPICRVLRRSSAAPGSS